MINIERSKDSTEDCSRTIIMMTRKRWIFWLCLITMIIMVLSKKDDDKIEEDGDKIATTNNNKGDDEFRVTLEAKDVNQSASDGLTYAQINTILNEPSSGSRTGFQELENLPSDFLADIKNRDNDVIKAKKYMIALSKKRRKRFRSSGNRGSLVKKVNNRMNMLPHKERLEKNEPKGCGYPICVEVDMIPRRFKSLCSFADWMANGYHTNRVFMVQKGACEQAMKGQSPKLRWARRKGEESRCKNHSGCNQTLCINDNGHAKSFDNVVKAVIYLRQRKLKKTNVIAVGLGTCTNLYENCIYTEWFDLDDPLKKGDIERVSNAHEYVVSSDPMYKVEKRTHYSLHRSCNPSKIKGDAEFQTTNGDTVSEAVGKQVLTLDEAHLQCLNKHNKKKLSKAYSWGSLPKQAKLPNVTCMDYRMRYCCQDLWGIPSSPRNRRKSKYHNNLKDDVMVHRPERDDLFAGCEWRQYISASRGGEDGDLESKDCVLALKGPKKAICDAYSKGARFVDARTKRKGIPWYETGEKIMKITAMWGLYCNSEHNNDSTCEDYKVRYCCIPQDNSAWSDWGAWSKCSKTCGKGTRSRDRACQAEGAGICGSDSQFKNQIESCNDHPCPKDHKMTEWESWSSCSVSCGSGTKTRFRTCIPGTQGQDCPPQGDTEETDPYTDVENCMEGKCIKPRWDSWTKFTKCTNKCGQVAMRIRYRLCVDANDENKKVINGGCLGSDSQNAKCPVKPCPVHGNWGMWQQWEACSIDCGKRGEGVKKRRRTCTAPSPKYGGEDCKGKAIMQRGCDELRPCKVDCLYSNWGGWSKCGLTCGDQDDVHMTSVFRYRHVEVASRHGGIPCSPVSTDSKQCHHCDDEKLSRENRRVCIKDCPIDCRLSEWNQWSMMCRSCYKPHFKEDTRTRTRYVEIEAEGGGKPCKTLDGKELIVGKAETQEKICKHDLHVPPCPKKKSVPYWGPWNDWSSCHIRCGKVKGKKTRTRSCYQQTSRPCKGKDVQKRRCTGLCLDDQPYSEWSEWTKCQVSCGKGKVTRFQKCNRFIKGRRNKRKYCKKGDTNKEVTDCDLGPCNDIDKSYQRKGKGKDERYSDEEDEDIGGEEYEEESSDEEYDDEEK